MREIGINGKQTKADLARNLKKSYATIDTTMSRNDEMGNDIKKLFWQNGTTTDTVVKQTLYSLTSFGITCLLRDHYKESGKPFLNLKEYSKFISIYEKEHSMTESGDEMSFDLVYSHLYFAHNPSIPQEGILSFKNNKLNKLTLSIKTIELKIKELEKQKKSKECEIHDELSSLITSSLKEK